MAIINKIKLQKKHLAFFTIVPLLAVTAFIKAPCPICHGEGQVSSTGMDEVYVANMVGTEITSIFKDGCDSYRVYQYSITLTLRNDANYDAGGYVNLILMDYQTGKRLDTQFLIVEVPAHTLVENTNTVYFMTTSVLDRPVVTEIVVDIIKNNVDCKACAGTGKVTLNSYALSNSLKETLFASQRIETPSYPPLFIDSEALPGDFVGYRAWDD